MSFDEFLKQPQKPAPISGGLLDRVEFPVAAFPGEYQEIINQAARMLKTDAAHVGTGILGAFSLAIGNTKRVAVSEHLNPIPATTWMVLVEASGGGKGRAQGFAFKPIEQFDEQRRITKNNSRKQLEDEIKRAKKGYMENKNTDKEAAADWKQEIQQNEKRLDDIKDEYLTMTDITMESVRTANLQNRRGIGIVREEISGFYNSFGRYAKGGGGSPEESFYIETYDGVPIKPFRNGGRSVVCDYPFTSVFGGTQPDTLGDLGKNNRLVSGFVFRFLFCYPDEKPLGKKHASDFVFDDKIKEVIQKYSDLINKALNDLPLKFKDELEQIPNPDTVVFSPEALEKYIAWQNIQADFANTLNVDPSTRRVIKSIVSRLDMNLFRLCLIMETMKWALGKSSLEYITGDTVSQCVKLMDYYRYTMLKVYSDVETIRFESAGKRPKRTQFDYKKVFNGRKELTRGELYDRLNFEYGVSAGTAEKYVLEDEKLPVPPILSTKDGRNKIYHLNDIK